MPADKDELFIVTSISREAIADELNNMIDGYPQSHQEFAADDDRLTKELCTEFAFRFGHCQGEDEDETMIAEEEMAAAFLNEFFPDIKVDK